MKQIKFWNEAEITEACREVELARKILIEVSKVTQKHEIPAEYILAICNRQWDLIKEIAKGLVCEDRDHFNQLEYMGEGLGLYDYKMRLNDLQFPLSENEKRLYYQWGFVDDVDYNIYERQDRRNLQLDLINFKNLFHESKEEKPCITGSDLFH